MEYFTQKKKLYLIAVLLMSVMSNVFAQLPASGYYRIQNNDSKKYVSIVDDKGSVNYQANTADFHSILLQKKWNAVCSNPATVIYLQNKGSENSSVGLYDLQAQGTGVAKILGTNVKVLDRKDGTYYAYGTKSGVSIYLSETYDLMDASDDIGFVARYDPKTQSNSQRAWIITPVSSSSANYFGVKPECSVNGKHYATLYADFGFKTASSGMKVYVISKKSNSAAALKEVTGVIPAKTPVIIECSSTDPANNKLDIVYDTNASPVNLLKGNMFRITSTEIFDARYSNLTPYNPATMRVLGLTSNGKLGLIKKDVLDYLPANSAYLEASGLDTQLQLLSETDFENSLNVAVTSVSLSQAELNLKKGATATLTATVNPDNATDKSLTWSTSNGNVATVDNAGKVTAVGAGNATITVTTKNGKTATCKVVVTVDADGITLNQTTLNLKKGATADLVATVTPNDATDKTVTWTTSNATVATIANGKVTAVGAGCAVITAKNSVGKTATCNVTVTVDAIDITLDNANLNLKKNETATLVATVTPADATDKTVVWTTSNAAVATVDNGKVTAVGAGNAVITAKNSVGKTATCNVIVTVDAAGITLSAANLNLKKNETATLVATVTPEDATDKTVTWTTNNTFVAIVENGVVTAVGAGNAVITAKNSHGDVATCDVNVTVDVAKVILDKSNLVLEVGSQETLTATVEPADATDKSISWTSDDISVATISNDGVVTAIAKGTTVLRATSINGLSASCEVTVEDNQSGINGVVVDADTKTSGVYTTGGAYTGKSSSRFGKGVYVRKGKKVLSNK